MKINFKIISKCFFLQMADWANALLLEKLIAYNYLGFIFNCWKLDKIDHKSRPTWVLVIPIQKNPYTSCPLRSQTANGRAVKSFLCLNEKYSTNGHKWLISIQIYFTSEWAEEDDRWGVSPMNSRLIYFVFLLVDDLMTQTWLCKTSMTFNIS